jgi:hypothetical protein
MELLIRWSPQALHQGPVLQNVLQKETFQIHLGAASHQCRCAFLAFPLVTWIAMDAPGGARFGLLNR